MDAQNIAIAETCLAGAHDDTLSFPQAVGMLMEAGFEAYLVDYRAGTRTHYLPGGRDAHPALPRRGGTGGGSLRGCRRLCRHRLGAVGRARLHLCRLQPAGHGGGLRGLSRVVHRAARRLFRAHGRGARRALSAIGGHPFRKQKAPTALEFSWSFRAHRWSAVGVFRAACLRDRRRLIPRSYASKGSRIRITSSRSGEVETSAQGLPTSSSRRRT